MKKISVTLHIPTRLTYGFPPPPVGIEIRDKKQQIFFDAEGLSDLNLIIEIGRGVALPLLAMWLYDTFIKKDDKPKPTVIKLRETVYRIETKDQLIEAISREVEVSQEAEEEDTKK